MIKQKFCLICILLILMLTPYASKGDSLFGINGIGYFHYMDSPNAHSIARQKMIWLKQDGAAWDRFDFWWGSIEPKPGVWKWEQADWIIHYYARHHIQMLPILCYQAAWMHQSPHTPEDFAEFANFVSHVVARYHRYVHIWEIWNEPNIPAFWKPAPDPAAYAALLKASYTAAHRADPHCTIVGAASNETDINWLRDIEAHGAFQAMDAVSIHPYSMADGPEQMHLAHQLRNVHHFLSSIGQPDMPIWITEMGWTSSRANISSMSWASVCMAQSYVIAASQHVAHLFWFSEQDWTEGGKLQGWGMISPGGHKKQTFFAYQELSRLLNGETFQKYIPLVKGSLYQFSRGKQNLYVLWAHHGQQLILPSLREGTNLVSFDGKRNTVTRNGIEVGVTPLFIKSRGDPFLTPLQKPEHPQPSPNLVVNGNLSDMNHSGAYGWRRGVFYGGNSDGSFGIDMPSHALTLSHTKQALWQSWPVPVMPGQKYLLTLQIKTEGVTGQNGAQMVFLSGPGWGWRGGPSVLEKSASTSGYRTLTFSGTVPDDADVIRIDLFSNNNIGIAEFRRIRLTRSR